MAIQTLTNAKVWVGGYDISGYLNSIALDDGVELHDVTALGDAARRRLAGIHNVTYQHEGFVDSSMAIDGILQGLVGSVDNPISVAPSAGAVGDLAYLFRGSVDTYSPSGEVGNPFQLSVGGEGSDGARLVRGSILFNGTATATAAGSAVNAGAVASGKSLYAVLHVLSASASDTLDVLVQSDDNSGFTSATTRITFAQASAIGSQWATAVAGPITDTYWRVNYTIGGVSPSFQFVVIIGFI